MRFHHEWIWIWYLVSVVRVEKWEEGKTENDFAMLSFCLGQRRRVNWRWKIPHHSSHVYNTLNRNQMRNVFTMNMVSLWLTTERSSQGKVLLNYFPSSSSLSAINSHFVSVTFEERVKDLFPLISFSHNQSRIPCEFLSRRKYWRKFSTLKTAFFTWTNANFCNLKHVCGERASNDENLWSGIMKKFFLYAVHCWPQSTHVQ